MIACNSGVFILSRRCGEYEWGGLHLNSAVMAGVFVFSHFNNNNMTKILIIFVHYCII